jgi:serine/threonine-protein kinase
MGEVFAAEHLRTGRTVAVKVLRADSKQKSSAVARFRREARAAGAINNDHVTQVLDVEEDAEQGIVLVFELLEGESLIDRLKRTGPMAFEELFGIVEQVWMGLSAAHAAGVVHRDLKPSNVFLERRPDGQQRVKILDFGISKLPREVGGDTLTEMGQSLGTFSFMPPEQIGKAKTVDHRADIYACATLIYQAMSGQLPYAAKNILQMVDLKTKSEPRALAKVLEGPVDPRLEAFLAKGLARDPADRFQSAQEALEVWRELKQPVRSAEPPQPSNRQPATVMMVDPRSYASNASAVAPPAAMQPRPGFSAPQMGGEAALQQAQGQRRPALGGTLAINASSINVPVVNDTTSEGGADHVATLAIPVRNVAHAVAQLQQARANSQAPQAIHQVPRLHDDPSSHSSVAGTQLMSHAALRNAGVPMPVQPSRSGYPQSSPTYAGAAESRPMSFGASPQQAVQQQAVQQQVSQPPATGQPGPQPGEGGDLTTVYRRDRPTGHTVSPSSLAAFQSGAVTSDKPPSRLVIILGVIAFAIVGFVVAAIVIGRVQTGHFPWE